MGNLAVVLAISLLLVRWDPTAPADQLDVTAAHLDRYEQVCSRRTQYSDRVCHNVAHFRSAAGRRFRFGYADLMRDFREDDAVELMHTAGGDVWAVRQDQVVVASYEDVKEERSHRIRLLRFFGLLGCLGVGVVAARRGVLRLRAGPPCTSPLCRTFDYGALAGLAVASYGIGLRALTVAVTGGFAAFVCFIGGIGWAQRRRHIDVGALENDVFSGPIAMRARQVKSRFGRWAASFSPPRESLGTPWRGIARISEFTALIGGLCLMGVNGSTLMVVVIPGEDEVEVWPLLWFFNAVGAALLLVAGLLGIALRRAAQRPAGTGDWLGWMILLSPVLFLLVLRLVSYIFSML